MRFGVCTWVFGDLPIQEIASSLSRMGFDGLELKGDLSLYSPADLRPLLQSVGLSVLSITPENVDLAYPDAVVRREALDYYLDLIAFARELECPVVSCHGAVGRVRAFASQTNEYRYLWEGVARLADAASAAGVRVAIEVLNRYESHLLNTAAQALAMVREIDHPALGILLDAYHMNIEEADPAGAVRSVGDRLFLFHVADSNRAAPGRGHTDFEALFHALREIDYSGDVIVECTASGPDPFTPVKGEGWREQLSSYLEESLHFLRHHLRAGHHT